MADQKLDNLLNLALDSTEEERKKSGNLNIGYEERSGNWDIIVKYSGDAEALSGERIRTVPLLGGYAVVPLSHPRTMDMQLIQRAWIRM